MTKAQARLAEIELAVEEDKERDRMVKAGKIRQLPVNDVFNWINTDIWVDTLGHWTRRDPEQPITVVIDSPGGEVMCGLRLYDAIKRAQRLGHHVTTHAQGMAASMAAVLLQAGDERVIDANAQLMIHEVSFAARGKTSEVEESAAQAKRLQDRLLNILAERSTLSKVSIAKRWKKSEWWMDAEEALKYGFVDRVE